MNETMIINHDRIKQVNDFRGLRFNSMSPTDIDGIIEFKNKLYIIFEMKCHGKQVPLGQKLCLERMVIDFKNAGKKSVCFICSHNTPVNDDIDVAKSTISEYHMGEKWVKASGKTSLRKGVEKILKRYGY